MQASSRWKTQLSSPVILDPIKEGILQCIRGRHAPRRVQHEEFINEPEGPAVTTAESRTVSRLELAWVGLLGLEHFELGQHVVIRPGLLRRRAQHSKDEVQLLKFRVAREKRLTKNELCKNAARRPHVHRRRVLGLSKQQLRGTVPKRDDVVCQSPLRRGLVRRVDRFNGPCKTKVGELDPIVSRNEDIGALQVPVDELLAMHILEHVQQLLHDVLDLQGLEVVPRINEPCEVMVHEL
mmetsp:Transcript_10205/g.29126  ORF Transcript_10205/g.29126 Transcript_10205/m.29126 type:complete len:238 (-) Transcript_10205:435-1148(-)